VAIANALQLEGRPTSRQSFCSVLLAYFVLRMRTSWHFRASEQSFDIAIEFSDPNFLKFGDQTTFSRCHLDL